MGIGELKGQHAHICFSLDAAGFARIYDYDFP
jgi:hypothetical protein